MVVAKHFLIWFVVLCSLHAGSAGATQTVTQPFLGVTLYHETETSPRPLSINVAVIDLSATGISFLVTPRGPGSPPLSTDGVPDETVIQTSRAFVNATGAQLAINASFYAISAIHIVNGLSWTNDNGLTASQGDGYSPWNPPPNSDNNYDDALNITSTNQASIVKMPSSVTTGYETNPTVSLYNAVTGKERLLQNGVVKAPSGASCGSFCDPNARTAAGLTSGNSKLILMTVDDDGAASQGVTLVELAGYLTTYGATNAINLDGGGSTQMAANYYGDGSNAKLVNSPGSERSVGVNLGVFALPNGDYNQNGVVDAGDYAVWRKSIGGQLAYDAWRAKYGSAGGSGSGTVEGSSVPEPSSAAFALIALVVGYASAQRRQRA